MGTSYEQIQTGVLNKLDVLFDPPHPKLMNGQPNPRYTAAVQVYLEALQPFQPWELEAGTKLALESHKYKRWPKPAEMRAFCFEAAKYNRPPQPKRTEAKAIERKPQSPEERAMLAEACKVMIEWHSSGQNHRTAKECKVEARRRIADRLQQQDKANA